MLFNRLHVVKFQGKIPMTNVIILIQLCLKFKLSKANSVQSFSVISSYKVEFSLSCSYEGRVGFWAECVSYACIGMFSLTVQKYSCLDCLQNNKSTAAWIDCKIKHKHKRQIKLFCLDDINKNIVMVICIRSLIDQQTETK